jgi:biofilm PGA synthesis N-glycosyltransferase PgaC
LQHVLEGVQAELFLVVDADAIPQAGALRLIVQQFVDPAVGAVTGNPRVRNVSNLLTAIQAMEYSVIISLAKRAEQFWGGLYTVSGAAACFRTAVLRAVGGWSDVSVTEDIEVSWRLQKAGYELCYEPRALFFIQTPRRLRDLYRQRRRWAQGMAEVLRVHKNLLGSRNPALIPIAVQALATAAWFALVVTTFLQAAWWLVQRGPTPVLFNAFTAADAWVVLACTMTAFCTQSFTACAFDGHYVRGVFKYLPLSLIYPLYYWVVVFPCFLLGFTRGLWSNAQGKWQRTNRVTE